MTQYELDLELATGIIKVVAAYREGHFEKSDQYTIKEGTFFGEVGDYIYNSTCIQVAAFTKRKMFMTNNVGNDLYQIGATQRVLYQSRNKVCDLYDILTEEAHFQNSLLYSTTFNTALFVISYVNWWHEFFTDGKFSIELRMKHLPELIDYVKGLPQNVTI